MTSLSHTSSLPSALHVNILLSSESSMAGASSTRDHGEPGRQFCRNLLRNVEVSTNFDLWNPNHTFSLTIGKKAEKEIIEPVSGVELLTFLLQH